MAIHILWYAPLVAWVLEHTGLCERSIHEEWTSVELYNRHEFFYETLIVSIVTYLSGIIPRAILLDREKLFELAANNAGTNCVLFSQNATRTLNHLSTCIRRPLLTPTNHLTKVRWFCCDSSLTLPCHGLPCGRESGATVAIRSIECGKSRLHGSGRAGRPTTRLWPSMCSTSTARSPLLSAPSGESNVRCHSEGTPGA